MSNAWDKFEEFKALPVDELTGIGADAKRKESVATALLKEATEKLRMAEDEVAAARSYSEMTSHALSEAALIKHQDIYGEPVSDDDREAFEQRWAIKVAEREAYFAEQRAKHERTRLANTN